MIKKTTLSLLAGLLASAAMLMPAQAQNRVSMAVQGTTSNAFPFSGVVRKGQYIYAPSDLTNLRSGPVDTLFFRANPSTTGSYSDNVLTDLVIAVTQVPQQQFANSTFLPVSDTIFRAATYTIPERGPKALHAIPLQRLFTYDSTQSVVFEISFTSNNGSARGANSRTNTGRRIILTNTGSQQLQNTQADVEFNVMASPVVGTQPRLNSRLLVYPNPARESVQVSLPTGVTTVTQVTLFSANGSQFTLPVQQQQNTLTLPLTDLPAGLYRLVLNLPEGTFAASVVKE